MRPGHVIRLYAMGLIVLTPGLLLWHRYGMNRVLRIDAKHRHRIQTVDDSGSGGGSRSTLRREDGRLVLDAQIAPGFAWPFAELDISLSDGCPGVDLTKYGEMRIRVDYQAPGSRQLRIFLRNCDPAYSDPLEPNTWKLHEAQFVPQAGGETKSIPLRAFTVTTWWLTDHRIPVEHASQDLRHVPLLQISTPGTTELGHHRIVIDYVEFRGKWLNGEQMALVIAGLWMTSTMLLLIMDLLHARRRLRQSRRREQELEELTSALQLENQVIEHLARRDLLTGVRNRAGILDELLHEAEASQRTGQSLAILMADVDHFKAVNDTHGHDVGDQVLCLIAREMESQIRKTDYLVRWGGEEFLLLCPATSLAAASALAEKVRLHVERSAWPHEMRITLSLGVTTLGPEHIPEALKRADRALYLAKGRGRNAVAILPAQEAGEAGTTPDGPPSRTAPGP